MKSATKEWLGYAENDYKDAKLLLDSKRYSGALFFLQQANEKVIKAYLVEHTMDKVPFVHDIAYLLRLTKLSLDELKTINLEELSLVYTRVRYPDLNKTHYTNKIKVLDLVKDLNFLYIWTRKQLKTK